MNRINSLIGSPSVGWRWCDGNDYNGFPTGINIRNNKKKNKVTPICLFIHPTYMINP